MAAPAPNQFPHHLEKWVYDKCKDSIFFIMITPKSKAGRTIRGRMDLANVVAIDCRDREAKGNRVGTGFVVEAGEADLKILTCAHLLDHVFSAKCPISAAEVNEMFNVQVVCDHAEVEYAQVIAARGNRPRLYSQAKIVDISCEKDLLLLQISRESVFSGLNARGSKVICGSQHPALFPSPNPPTALEDCVMLSWPPHLHRTTAKGKTSHCSRTIDVMPGKNLNGYTMGLMQVDIRSDIGASGSPLLDGEGDIIGVLHGAI